jgi:glycerol kinase
MKNVANPKSQRDIAEAQKSLIQSGTAVSEVLTSVARNIQLIQSNAGAEIFTRSLDSLVPAFSPNGAPYWFQQLPHLYTLEANCLMKTAADTFSELLRAQQTLMEMASQSTLQSVQESAESTTQTLSKFYSRRVSSQVIQFPDRRAA